MNIYCYEGLMEDLFHRFNKIGPVNPEQVYSSLYFDEEGEPMVEIDCNDGFFFGDEATGFFNIRTLDGTKVNKGSVSYKKLRIQDTAKAYLKEVRTIPRMNEFMCVLV